MLLFLQEFGDSEFRCQREPAISATRLASRNDFKILIVDCCEAYVCEPSVSGDRGVVQETVRAEVY